MAFLNQVFTQAAVKHLLLAESSRFIFKRPTGPKVVVSYWLLRQIEWCCCRAGILRLKGAKILSAATVDTSYCLRCSLGAGPRSRYMLPAHFLNETLTGVNVIDQLDHWIKKELCIALALSWVSLGRALYPVVPLRGRFGPGRSAKQNKSCFLRFGKRREKEEKRKKIIGLAHWTKKRMCSALSFRVAVYRRTARVSPPQTTVWYAQSKTI